MKKKKVVIIGGGLAGLSAGYHLLEQEPILFEKESVVGGLCRSFTQDGFTFDCTGHLIHLKNPYTKDLVTKLLPDAFNAHERLAKAESCGVRHGAHHRRPGSQCDQGPGTQVKNECLRGHRFVIRLLAR